jgi:hypothetical protein
MNHLSLEIIAEIVSYLDYTDQENVFVSSRAFFHARGFTLFRSIQSETQWLTRQQNLRRIPRQELLSHNALLRLLNRAYAVTRPSPETTSALAELYANELIVAWMVPVNVHGVEIRVNDSLEDTRLYHERYPLLERLGIVIRWTGAGKQVGEIIEKWLDSNWEEIKDDDEVQEFQDPDYDLPPSDTELQPQQTKVLRGLEFLALFPIIYYAPQDAAADHPASNVNADAWRHPGFHRLKLWLSIPELWNTEIRHLEIREFLRPQYRVYRQIATRPLLQVVLFRSAEVGGFAQQLLKYLRNVELSSPYIDHIRGTRYWYEEGFCASALYWNFYLLSFPGQYMSLFQKPLVDIIRGYINLYGPETLSDLIHNMVFFVSGKSLPLRNVIARTVMSELLIYGYDYLSTRAKDAVVGLMKDRQGRFVAGVSRVRGLDDEPPRDLPQSG